MGVIHLVLRCEHHLVLIWESGRKWFLFLMQSRRMVHKNVLCFYTWRLFSWLRTRCSQQWNFWCQVGAYLLLGHIRYLLGSSEVCLQRRWCDALRSCWWHWSSTPFDFQVDVLKVLLKVLLLAELLLMQLLLSWKIHALLHLSQALVVVLNLSI